MNTKEKIAIMQAFENGGKIESRHVNSVSNTQWHTTSNPIWDWCACNYRVKEPTVLELLEDLQKHIDKCSHISKAGVSRRLDEIINRAKL